jgi:hypothetical protein
MLPDLRVSAHRAVWPPPDTSGKPGLIQEPRRNAERDGLSAGGSWIRTLGSAPKQALCRARDERPGRDDPLRQQLAHPAVRMIEPQGRDRGGAFSISDADRTPRSRVSSIGRSNPYSVSRQIRGRLQSARVGCQQYLQENGGAQPSHAPAGAASRHLPPRNCQHQILI